MRTEVKAYKSATEVLQNKINAVIYTYNARKAVKHDDVADTFEAGFIRAMKEVNRVYELDIDFSKLHEEG